MTRKENWYLTRKVILGRPWHDSPANGLELTNPHHGTRSTKDGTPSFLEGDEDAGAGADTADDKVEEISRDALKDGEVFDESHLNAAIVAKAMALKEAIQAKGEPHSPSFQLPRLQALVNSCQ